MKTMPEAVVTGPPIAGSPIGIRRCIAMPSGPLSCKVPNGIDQSNRVSAHATMRLPRSGWSIVATPPYGTNRLLAIVSQTPRDFGAAGLTPAGDFNEFRLDAAKAQYERHQDPWPFLSGRPECTEPCTSAFGAAEFNVEVIRKK